MTRQLHCIVWQRQKFSEIVNEEIKAGMCKENLPWIFYQGYYIKPAKSPTYLSGAMNGEFYVDTQLHGILFMSTAGSEV